MSKTTLTIMDEVNIRFSDLDSTTRRKLSKAVEYEIPGGRFTPAARLGRWNPVMTYCDISGKSFLNLLDKLVPIVQAAGYEIDIVDQRIPMKLDFEKVSNTSYEHVIWPEGHQLVGQPVFIKDHQVKIINACLENPQGVGIVPTGGGKTIITAILSHKCEKYGRTVLIVPSKDLVTQTEEDYRNFGLDVGVYFGDRKEYGHTHTICTWQSLDVLLKNSLTKNPDVTINDFIDGVNCVIVDETHRVTGSSLRTLLSGIFKNVPIRWGVTGTLPEQEMDRIALLCCVGPVIGRIDTLELQELGILSNLDIKIWQLKDVGNAFKEYASELKWLTTSKPRIEFLAKKFEELGATGNTLILVDRIETGNMLQSLIPNSVFIDGSMKSKDRKSEYKEVASVDGKIIIGTYGCISTGVNIPRVFNLVLFEAGKSFVRVIQSIGRGLRVAEDKDFVNVIDVCSTSKFSKRHLSKRKAHYAQAGYPFSVNKLDY